MHSILYYARPPTRTLFQSYKSLFGHGLGRGLLGLVGAGLGVAWAEFLGEGLNALITSMADFLRSSPFMKPWSLLSSLGSL